MARCPAGLLDDLADVLAAVRRWPRVVERSPGVFYVGRTPFLHFHALRTGRVADARDGRDWGERIALDPPLGPARRRALRRELQRRQAAGEIVDIYPYNPVRRLNAAALPHG